jgi:tetraacyldisaccharide 4'-kinase
MNKPRFWSEPAGFFSFMLAPFAWFYDLIVRLRWRFKSSHHIGVPVICAGNFTLGGAGKTPAVIYIVERLKAWGERPFILTRGYGGAIRGPYLVDPHRDHAEEVGDEALILAKAAPTFIGADRTASARSAIAQGASILVMDDGMQNPHLKKDLTLAFIDGKSGIGNACVFPAGPLRANLNWQKKRADVIIVVKTPENEPHSSLKNFNLGKAFYARLDPENADWLKERRVLAFCGIGEPQKFHATLKQLGAEVIYFKSYPDHYVYTAHDAKYLIEQAAKDNLTLVTTEKDHARLRGSSETRAQLAGLSNIVAIKFIPEEAEKFDTLLKSVLSPANIA